MSFCSLPRPVGHFGRKLRFLSMVLTTGGFGTVLAGSFPEIQAVADGQVLKIPTAGVRIPSDTRNLVFEIGKAWREQDADVQRFRYKLDGYDEAWHFRTADMGLTLRFHDAKKRLLGDQALHVTGESPGWKGSFEDSALVRRREHVIVPPEAVNASLYLTSAGSPNVIGSFLAGNIAVYRHSEKGELELLYEPTFRSGPAGKIEPLGWLKDGTHPSMGEMVELKSLDHSQVAFAVVDDDPVAHAEWRLKAGEMPPVNPGEDLIVEWDEMYSIGLATNAVAEYHGIPAGSYQFCVQILDAMGIPRKERAIPVDVYKPLWLQPWIWAMAAIFGAVIFATLLRRIIQRRVRIQLRRMEQEHMVERERLRIARDIHDDLGARLTQISLMSSSAKKDAGSLEDARQRFQRMSEMTRDLVSALYETVWTVDPGNDHLEALVNHLIQMIDAMCLAAGIGCRIWASPKLDYCAVTSDIRHHITLAVKEAAHNAIKYSAASEVSVRLEWDEPFLTIQVCDNGRGFCVETVREGRGLSNMRDRMKAVNGQVTIESKPDEGTTITFQIKIV